MVCGHGKNRGNGSCRKNKIKRILDLDKDTCPNREQRANGTNVYYGKASELLQDAKDGNIKISVNKNKNKIKITIEDDGRGMTKEELKKITKAFFTTKKNGTGLGVYLSNEIIKAHNGSIKYSSVKNKGTKVVITIPK